MPFRGPLPNLRRMAQRPAVNAADLPRRTALLEHTSPAKTWAGCSTHPHVDAPIHADELLRQDATCSPHSPAAPPSPPGAAGHPTSEAVHA